MRTAYNFNIETFQYAHWTDYINFINGNTKTEKMRLAIECKTLQEWRIITESHPHCMGVLTQDAFTDYEHNCIEPVDGCFSSTSFYQEEGYEIISAQAYCHIKGIEIKETHTMVLDGKEVEISEDSYQEMRKLFKD